LHISDNDGLAANQHDEVLRMEADLRDTSTPANLLPKLFQTVENFRHS